VTTLSPTSISSISRLDTAQRREIYARLIPPEILADFGLSPYLVDVGGNDLLEIDTAPGGSAVELSLFHQNGARDPILYGHLTDSLNGQIHVLLYIMNNPHAPRFDVDQLPDGSPTRFGTLARNLEAEAAALKAGLLPGQIREGLHRLKEAQASFERFVASLGHGLYFVEPLYYHNAIIFEQYGFAYQSGRRLMERIHRGFSAGGEFLEALDGSLFRNKEAERSIRWRSWAIHDGIMGQPFDRVTMYKTIGKGASMSTAPGLSW
jgi:hypothetical protein